MIKYYLSKQKIYIKIKIIVIQQQQQQPVGIVVGWENGCRLGSLDGW